MAIPLVLYPRFLDKTIFFPNTDPRGPGIHNTLLQSPLGPVPELCLVLPWRAAAGGTRHRSPVSMYTLGLENFPPGIDPRGAKGATISTPLTVPYLNFDPAGPVPRGPFYSPHTVLSLELFLAWLFRGVSLLGAFETDLLCQIYPLGLDKTNLPRVTAPRWAKGATIPTTRTSSRT